MPRIAVVLLVDRAGCTCCSSTATSTRPGRANQWGMVGGHVEDG